VGARFFEPVQTGPGAHPASCTMGTGSFPVVKSGRGVTLTTHPLLVTWSRKSRAIPLLPIWAVRPVQSHSACTRVYFTYLNFLSARPPLSGKKANTKPPEVLHPFRRIHCTLHLGISDQWQYLRELSHAFSDVYETEQTRSTWKEINIPNSDLHING